ncbi:hypothetical protein OsJ_23732 [Oryza sativa Japonica Group]|uniref:Uncharacterized protein n=1 Tax=Oryza sativa subsp. japonica TaxID=39947 RepID=A3BIA8_ORYSJ|nr:hypothetical protein OsJ_23732 [Oryza sativa Japonica Group]
MATEGGPPWGPAVEFNRCPLPEEEIRPRFPKRRSTHVAEKEIHVGGRLLEHELCNFLHRRSWRSGGRGEAAKVGDKTSVQLPGMRPT